MLELCLDLIELVVNLDIRCDMIFMIIIDGYSSSSSFDAIDFDLLESGSR